MPSKPVSPTLNSEPAMRPFSQSLPMALLQAREAAMRLFRPMLQQHDLTEQQWRVLRALSSTTTPLEVTQLAELTFLLPPSLSRILANLEQRSLIDRQSVEHDGRRAQISLAPAGVALVRQIAPTSEATYESIEAAYGQAKLKKLLVALHELASIDHQNRDAT